MNIPPVTRWIAGEEVNADVMQARVNDVLNFLLEPPQAHARASVAQSVTSGVWTKLLLDTTVKDNDGIVDLSTDKLTCQTPGWYEVMVSTGFIFTGTGDTTGKRVAGARLNGSSSNGGIRGRRDVVPTSGNSAITGGALTSIFLNKGDYLELMGFQSSGVTRNTYVATIDAQPYIAMRWVSN